MVESQKAGCAPSDSATSGLPAARARIAFGPEAPAFGSWWWLGADLASSLAGRYRTSTFRDEVGPADVVVIIKFLPPQEILRELRRTRRIIFCPVDVYGSSSEIDADAGCLLLCDRIIVHCERLTRYFRSYASVVALPHHVKYIANILPERPADGPLLWIGVRGNLPPVVEWANRHELPAELVVLTDVEKGVSTPTPRDLGFRRNAVRVEPWIAENHLAWLSRCRAAIDIKGGDFRSRHKPDAKVCDYIASGVPVAVLPDSSAAESLGRLGFELASPNEERWLSDDYLSDTIRFGRALRELHSLERVTNRWVRVIEDVLADR